MGHEDMKAKAGAPLPPPKNASQNDHARVATVGVGHLRGMNAAAKHAVVIVTLKGEGRQRHALQVLWLSSSRVSLLKERSKKPRG